MRWNMNAFSGSPALVTLEQGDPQQSPFRRVVIRTCFGELRCLVPSNLSPEECITGLVEEYRELFPQNHIVWSIIDPQSKMHRFYASDMTLEAAIIEYDNKQRAAHCDFAVGVVMTQPGDMALASDDDIYARTDTNPDFEEFLDLLGKRTLLHGYRGYTGGLDIKTGLTGTEFVRTSYRSDMQKYRIAFHVSTLLAQTPSYHQHHHPPSPSATSATASSVAMAAAAGASSLVSMSYSSTASIGSAGAAALERNGTVSVAARQHLNADRVMVVFHQDTDPFDPRVFGSQDIHCWILVKKVGEEMIEDRVFPLYSIAYISKGDTPPCYPLILEEVYIGDHEFHELLIAKIINAQNTLLNFAPAFATRRARTRATSLSDLIDKFDPSHA